jgi:hypothetical protein
MRRLRDFRHDALPRDASERDPWRPPGGRESGTSVRLRRPRQCAFAPMTRPRPELESSGCRVRRARRGTIKATPVGLRARADGGFWMGEVIETDAMFD